MAKYTVVSMPGDGIGKEVVPEGIRVLEAVAGRHGIAFEWQHFDWSCETFEKTGRMMPEDGLEQLGGHDAIFMWDAEGSRGGVQLEVAKHETAHLLNHLLSKQQALKVPKVHQEPN